MQSNAINRGARVERHEIRCNAPGPWLSYRSVEGEDAAVKRSLLGVAAAFVWIGGTLFLRNEVLLKSFWLAHYAELGITFPSEPINGVVWIAWSLLFAVFAFLLSRRFSWVETAALSWFGGFVLMEIVIGNLGVLPLGLLPYAIPMSLVEVVVAAFLIDRIAPRG